VPRRLALLAAAAVVLLVPSTASATTLVLPDGTQRPQPYQSWVDRAKVPTPPGVVTLRLEGCDGLAGCAPEGQEVVAVAREWMSPQVLLHELGHVFDDAMPAWARPRFEALVGKHGPWASAAGSGPPNEQFAEAYSLCARRTRIRERYYGSYDFSVTPGQHRRICALIRAASAP
jgi:hypothetical protein